MAVIWRRATGFEPGLELVCIQSAARIHKNISLFYSVKDLIRICAHCRVHCSRASVTRGRSHTARPG